MQPRRWLGRAAIWTVLMAVLAASHSAHAAQISQSPIPTEARLAEPTLIDIRQRYQYQNERVTIQGNIGRVIERSGSNAFELSDRFGDTIEVRSSSELPPKGVTYRITGQITPAEDRSGRPPVIIEEARVQWNPVTNQPVGSVAEIPTGSQPTSSGAAPNPIVMVLIVATVVVLLALFGVLIFMLTRGNTGGGGTGQMSGPLPAMPATEGGTIKLAQPTTKAINTGTVKVLPGRFKVLAGEETIPEIRLFIGRDNHGREFTLGRIDNGAAIPANHIGFKTSSVSSKQGKLLCSPEGKYTIINYADPETKNPIVVNGRGLGAGEAQELKDQDTIEIGTVKLQYNAT